MKLIGHIFDSAGNEYMPVYEGGLIARESRAGMPETYWRPSGKWVLTGAVERNNFGHVVRRYSLSDLLRLPINWQHKNGKQKVFITDLDHGARRIWGGRKHSFVPLPAGSNS